MPEGKPWPKEDDTLLTTLWLSGLTAKEIADRFPERTRNAIIGRVHRLKLKRENRRSVASVTIKTQEKRAVTRSTPFRPKSQIVVEAQPSLPLILDVPPNGVRIQDLRWYHCREVIDGHGAPDGLALFCGRTVSTGQSFCSEHAAKNYQPLPRRRA